MEGFELFRIGFLPIRVIDIVDILAIAYVCYYIFALLRGTRAAQMIVGLIVLLIASFVTDSVNMSGLSWLLSHLRTAWVFAIIILFQPELRRMLIRLGQSRAMRLFYRVQESRVVDEVVNASRVLSEREYGALIVIVRDVGIAAIIETGVPIQAELSADLLTTIFTPRSPLHDMASVIQGNLVVAAKCELPLSQSAIIDRSMGTRHRAALGLSEESDAVVIMVSEETSQISIAVDGKFIRNLSPEQLKDELIRLVDRR